MADELTSIEGRRLGISALDYLTGTDDSATGGNFRGLQIGNSGRTFFVGSPVYINGGLDTHFDDFHGAVINTNLWDVNKGSDGAAVNFAVLLAQPGGVVRGTTGANASADMAGNGVQICGGLNFLASSGGTAMEAVIKPAAITTCNLFVGFHDTTAHTLQAPFTISGGVVTANAANAVGLVFDTAATASTIKFVSVNASGTPQVIDTGLAPITTGFQRWRVGVTSGGNASFFIGGTLGSPAIAGQNYNIAAAIATTSQMGPKVEYFRRAATATNIDIDWIMAEQRLNTAVGSTPGTTR